MGTKRLELESDLGFVERTTKRSKGGTHRKWWLLERLEVEIFSLANFRMMQQYLLL